MFYIDDLFYFQPSFTTVYSSHLYEVPSHDVYIQGSGIFPVGYRGTTLQTYTPDEPVIFVEVQGKVQ